MKKSDRRTCVLTDVRTLMIDIVLSEYCTSLPRRGGIAEGCTSANHFCRLIYSDFLERETLVEPQKVNIYISRGNGIGE